jgi:4-hydroxy-3-methylbut-2-enyl diphosphate reductase
MNDSTDAMPTDERHTSDLGAEVSTVSAGEAVIHVARYAGYCYGVERALGIAESAIGEYESPIYTLGPIIHNPSVVKRLEEGGIVAVDDMSEVRSGTVVVRTHGVPPDVIDDARRRGLRIVDATCPFVTIAQRKAQALQKLGYLVVILGERDHPEVAGIKACAGSGAIVLQDVGQLPDAVIAGRRVGIVVQTTQTQESLARLAAAVAPRAREMLVYNTICDATEKRQNAAREVAAMVDVVVVVGGRNSANTRRLEGLCREIQPRTHHVERAGELEQGWVHGCLRVGVTAGASTPSAEIDAVVEALRAMLARA